MLLRMLGYKEEDVGPFWPADYIAQAQAVLVGDRLHDVEGAKQCGIDCIGVTFGFGDREELEDAGAKHVIDRVEELLPLLL